MNKAITFSISLALLALAVSCKEEKKETAKIAVAAHAPAPTLSVKDVMTPEQKRLKEGNKRLGWVMQDLDIPEYKLDKFHKSGDLLTESYIKYATEIIKVAKTAKDVDHPDEKLTNFKNEMLAALAKYEEAFQAKHTEKIKSTWTTLKNACSACHKEYRTSSGGY